MTKTIKYLYNECCRILRNDRGLYHGWIDISTSKYGGANAFAIKNPPEDSDWDMARTSSAHHYAYGENSLHEVLSKLHEELVQWEIDGKPFDSYKEKEKIDFKKPVKWKLRQSQFNTSMYLHVARDYQYHYGVYGIHSDISGNYYWSVMAPPQDLENEDGWSIEPVPDAKSIWEYSQTLEMPESDSSSFT